SVISSMTRAAAGFALFLDVSDFPAGRHLTIPADHAAASERGEAEKPNETHRVLRLNRGAIYVPRHTAFAAARQARFAALRLCETGALVVRSTHIGTEIRGVHARSMIAATSDL